MIRKQVFPATVLVLSCILVLVGSTAWAVVPHKINYQGRITDSDTGVPLAGTYEVVFRIFDVETEGVALWSETQSVTPDSAGVFSRSRWLVRFCRRDVRW